MNEAPTIFRTKIRITFYRTTQDVNTSDHASKWGTGPLPQNPVLKTIEATSIDFSTGGESIESDEDMKEGSKNI